MQNTQTNDVKKTSSIVKNTFSIHSVTSKDGTEIGYRRYGHGPGIVFVQGAMGIAHNYDQLALAMANDFTIYVPDRRGRRMSARAFTPDHTIERDVEDLESVLAETGAHFVFGLSSGAIITLETARVCRHVHKAAVYEPPFYYNAAVPVAKIDRIYREIGKGDFAAALVSVNGVVKLGPKVLNFIPRPLLQLLTGTIIRNEEKKGTGDYASLRELIPAMRYDFRTVLNRGSKLDLFKTVQQEVLLLGGTKSPTYLKNALYGLELTLPRNRRIEFDGLNHSAPWNADRGGNPRIVADCLIEYFR